MTNGDRGEIVAFAVLLPILTAAVMYAARRAFRWFAKALARSFADTVAAVVAPDLARMGTRVGQSVDELRQQNAREHKVTAVRLGGIEDRLSALEGQLIRPADARTRATDNQEENE